MDLLGLVGQRLLRLCRIVRWRGCEYCCFVSVVLVDGQGERNVTYILMLDTGSLYRRPNLMQENATTTPPKAKRM